MHGWWWLTGGDNLGAQLCSRWVKKRMYFLIFLSFFDTLSYFFVQKRRLRQAWMKKRHFSRKKGACGKPEDKKRNFSPKKGPCGHAEPQKRHFSPKKSPCGHALPQQSHFSPKKGPCGHAEPQQSNFSPKKGPCGHAQPQPSHISTKNSYFFKNRCIDLLYFPYGSVYFVVWGEPTTG